MRISGHALGYMHRHALRVQMPQQSSTYYRSPPLLAALAVAVLIGFITPRPTFVDTFLGGSTTDFMATETQAGNASVGATAKSAGAHPLVQVDFYGESLCPDCRHMVLDVLDPLFRNGVSKLFKLRYVAYGNVQGDPTVKGEKISCQHGPKECLYNRYINCVQDMLGHDQDKWFPYVRCMAEHMNAIEEQAPGCAAAVGLKADDVAACANGPDGDRFEMEAGVETRNLKPKHNFVPWVGCFYCTRPLYALCSQ